MKAAALLLLMLILPSAAFAAQVFGMLTGNGRPIRGARVLIQCEGNTYSGDTQDEGSYSVYVRQQGRCDLTVEYGQQTTRPFSVYSYGDPVRYDFELVQDSDGRYRLDRIK